MKVIDCTANNFKSACQQLADGVITKIKPDLWIGVETGGGIVLRTIAQNISSDINCSFVNASRSKSDKSTFVKFLIKLFPKFINNILRNTEQAIRCSIYKRNKKASERYLNITTEVLNKINTASVIIIIDDAVDTGSTLMQIIKNIKALNCSVKIYTACIVQTMQDPLIVPDVLLYRDVIVRFPWSQDS